MPSVTIIDPATQSRKEVARLKKLAAATKRDPKRPVRVYKDRVSGLYYVECSNLLNLLRECCNLKGV